MPVIPKTSGSYERDVAHIILGYFIVVAIATGVGLLFP